MFNLGVVSLSEDIEGLESVTVRCTQVKFLKPVENLYMCMYSVGIPEYMTPLGIVPLSKLNYHCKVTQRLKPY